MSALIRFFPPAASRFAHQVDLLFFFLCAVTVFFVTAIAGTILVFGILYRRSRRPDPPPRVNGTWWTEAIWIGVPLVINLVTFVWGAKLYLSSFHVADPNAYEVFAIGKQWMWKFQHPNGRREVGELHLPRGRQVRLILISQDVIHDTFIPAFRVKHDVLPMKYSSVIFEPDRVGRYHLFCAQYCGTKHSQMTGWVDVMEPERFRSWMADSRGQGSPAAEGAALLEVLGCRSCHRTDSLQRAPSLEGLFGGMVTLNDGRTVRADENYLRESILNPAAQVVAHFQPVMPSYRGRLSEEQIVQILAYLKSVPRREP